MAISMLRFRRISPPWQSWQCLRSTLPFRAIRWAAPLLLGLSMAAAHAATVDLDRARNAMQSGQPKAAYDLLAPHEAEMAGDKTFDYLLGIAALDAGHPDRATLALERVLAMDPNAAGARLDMARAYFALGNLQRARHELTLLSRQNPPPAARKVIDDYLAAITERENVRRTVVTGFIEGTIGYDTNITSVTGDFSSAVEATYNLVGFRPTGASVRRGAPIAGAASGIDVTHQIDRRFSLYGGAEARHQSVTRDHAYDSDEMVLRGGGNWVDGKDSLRLGLTFQRYLQVTDVPTAYRNTYGLNGEWRHDFSPTDQGSVYGVLSRQRYADIPSADVNSWLGGAGWFHTFQGNAKPLLYATAYVGRDNATQKLANGADTSKDLAGWRLYAQVSPTEQLDLYVSGGITRRYDRSPYARATMIVFGNDLIRDATIGATWRLSSGWSVRPQLQYSSDRSNVALSNFDRTRALITIRRDFY